MPTRSGHSILRLALGFFSGHLIRSRVFKSHGSLALHMMYQLVIIPCLSSPCAFRFHRFPKFVDDVGKRKPATLGGVLFALLAATSGCRHPEITRNICVSSLKLRFRTRLSTTLPLSGSSTARTRIQLYFSPERALHVNASPCLFWLVCRPEHSTVRCAGGCRHERAHRLMASMGLSRLDDLSLWTQHSRTARDTASSSSLISPRLLQVYLAIAFPLYIGRALSLAPVVESILFRPPACRFGQSGCVRGRSTSSVIWRGSEVLTQRHICGSPPGEDQVVRRCRQTTISFYSRLSTMRKSGRERTLLVDPVLARVSMASPAPMKSIPFPLLRKSNRHLACGTPFLRYPEFCRHTLGTSVYVAFEYIYQLRSAWTSLSRFPATVGQKQ